MKQALVITALLALIPGVGTSPAVGAAEDSPPVAIVDGTPIPADLLDDLIQGQLAEIRQREDQARRMGLDELIAQMLLEREAAARGVSVEELTRVEVTDKARVSPAEARRFYENNRSRFSGMGEAAAIQQIVNGMGRQRERERRSTFARELRGKYHVEILLEPFRLEVGTGPGPLRGNPEAPVTIVEFSDFQCPYCVRARSTVNRIRETYGDQVNFAYRHFPLDFHELAQKAGEAAACANDQGRFWDMHDRLWKANGQLQVSDLKNYALAIGLDTAAFNECLDSGRHASVVEADAQEGARLGVSGTPAFYINGRPLVGAHPFDAFALVIDEEIARANHAAATGSAAR
jgi:predicted DsbA family dithiol-disulfide isomerase